MTAIFHFSNHAHRGFGRRLIQALLRAVLRLVRAKSQAAPHDEVQSLQDVPNDTASEDAAMTARVDMLLRFFERAHAQGAGRS